MLVQKLTEQQEASWFARTVASYNRAHREKHRDAFQGKYAADSLVVDVGRKIDVFGVVAGCCKKLTLVGLSTINNVLAGTVVEHPCPKGVAIPVHY